MSSPPEGAHSATDGACTAKGAWPVRPARGHAAMRKNSLIILILGLISACSSGTTLSLSTRTGPASSALGATGAAAAPLAAGPGIQLSRVRLVVDEIKLEPVGGTTSSSDGGTSGEEVIAGPYLID